MVMALSMTFAMVNTFSVVASNGDSTSSSAETTKVVVNIVKDDELFDELSNKPATRMNKDFDVVFTVLNKYVDVCKDTPILGGPITVITVVVSSNITSLSIWYQIGAVVKTVSDQSDGDSFSFDVNPMHQYTIKACVTSGNINQLNIGRVLIHVED